jgi:hypothetical protein
MPLSAKRVLGTFRYAMYFDGIDDYVNCGNVQSFDVLTAEVLVNIREYSTGLIIGQVAPAWYSGWWIRPIFYVVGYGIARGINWIYNQMNLSSLPISLDGIWHHYAGVFDGSKMYGYRDGALVNSMTPTTPTPQQIGPVYIGYNNVDRKYFKGLITVVRVYNRALSGSEIAFNYTHPNDPVKDGLVLWLVAHPDYIKDIDNDGILEWIDLSGNNNHGKIYGAVLTKVIKYAITVNPSRRILPVVR